MPSLQNALAVALSRKKVPAFTAGSIHSLAQQLKMTFPGSLQALIALLADLPSASITVSSGDLTAGDLHGSATLFLQSDGAVAFQGAVSEHGVLGDNFLLSVTLVDVTDASGKCPTLSHSDAVVGAESIGFSDKDWLDIGFSQFIADKWDQVRTSRFRFYLYARTDPLGTVAESLQAIGIAIGLVLGAIFVAKICSDENSSIHCGFVPVGSPNAPMSPGGPAENRGAGIEFQCRCESNGAPASNSK